MWVCFFRVIKALNRIAKDVIKWPNPAQRIQIANNFRAIKPIDNVVGSIDGTYVPIKAPRVNPNTYINRKCFHGITLQAVADSTLKFTHCYTGYPSSVPDIRIFKNSDIYNNILLHPEEYFNDHQFIIGDKAYPLYKWCIPPYIDRGNLGILETNFNSVHAGMRQVIERTFALYFGRLRRMQYLDMNRADLYAPTILAACVVHNICLLRTDDQVNDFIAAGMPRVIANGVDEQHVEAAIDLRMLNNEGRNKRNRIAQDLLRRYGRRE